jgi:hypothetical protein
MLKIIFWTIVIILALSFFGISLQSIVSSDAAHANFAYLGNLLLQVWNWIVSGIRYLIPF